jgi:hypothetical protein
MTIFAILWDEKTTDLLCVGLEKKKNIFCAGGTLSHSKSTTTVSGTNRNLYRGK